MQICKKLCPSRIKCCVRYCVMCTSVFRPLFGDSPSTSLLCIKFSVISSHLDNPFCLLVSLSLSVCNAFVWFFLVFLVFFFLGGGHFEDRKAWIQVFLDTENKSSVISSSVSTRFMLPVFYANLKKNRRTQSFFGIQRPK